MIMTLTDRASYNLPENNFMNLLNSNIESVKKNTEKIIYLNSKMDDCWYINLLAPHGITILYENDDKRLINENIKIYQDGRVIEKYHSFPKSILEKGIINEDRYFFQKIRDEVEKYSNGSKCTKISDKQKVLNILESII